MHQYQTTWVARRTLPVHLAARLVAAFRLQRRQHAWRWNDDGTVTVAFLMIVRS